MFLFDWFYGILASLGLWQKEAKILFLGLNEFDKFVVLRTLNAQHQPHSITKEFSIGKIKFKAYDLGGHRFTLRVLRDYHVQVDAVVYLVDADNKMALFKSSMELCALLSHESLANVPFLVLGGTDNLPVLLDLENLTTTGKGMVNLAEGVRPLEVFMWSCSKEGCGEGFEWLSQYIK